MSTHTAYRVVEAQYINNLEIEVNEAVRNGWQCIGGVGVLPNGYLVQSMVKPAETTSDVTNVQNNAYVSRTAELAAEAGAGFARDGDGA